MPLIDPDQAAARTELCRFLSACYYEPAEEFAEEKLFDSMLAAASRVDQALADSARRLGQAFAAQDLQTLLVDYTRLFLGPMQALAQPYASTWLAPAPSPDEDAAATTMDLYAEGGFEVDADFQERPDHVALELEFLYLLNFRIIQAQQDSASDDIAAAEQLRHRFLREHLGLWIGPFVGAVQAGAETTFYRELATFTGLFMDMELGRLPVH